MPREVDPLKAGCHASEQALDELALGRGQRDHRAVVVGVGVDVEHARRGKGVSDRLHGRAVAPLAEVRHGEQLRTRHGEIVAPRLDGRGSVAQLVRAHDS